MKLLFTLFTGIALIFYSCTPTPSIQQSWTNPQQRDSTKVFQKILLVALLKDAYTRKVAEDKLAEQVKPRGVVSYNYLPNYQANADTGLISNRLKQDGFDGIVIMRFVTIDKNTTNSPPSNQPSYYNTWYGYYSTTFPLYNVPGNTAANEIYNVETNVYSLVSNKLLWSGVTTAVNISNKSQMIDRIIAIIKQKMKDQGFLK